MKSLVLTVPIHAEIPRGFRLLQLIPSQRKKLIAREAFKAILDAEKVLNHVESHRCV